MSSESPDESTHQPLLSQLVHSIFSSTDDNNVMMAAIISLVVVILFVFILHLYARCSFHSRSLNRRRRRRNHRTSALTLPSSFVDDLPPLSGSATKGLDPSAISAIPLFVYEAAAMATDDDDEAECVICLSEFDGGDVYRRLPKCGHEFHVECVDMWLRSHSNCPICRAPTVAVVPEPNSISSEETDSPALGVVSSVDNGDGFLTIDIVTGTVDNDNNNSSGGANDCSSSSFGYSLKRMLSRNRSGRKVSLAASNVVCSSSTDQLSRE